MFGALSRFWDRHEPWPKFTQFTHALPEFALPRKGPPPDPLPKVAILTPCRDAESDLARYFGLVDALDYPRDRVHLRLLAGDSRDETFAVAEALLAEREGRFASTDLIKLDLQTDISRVERKEVSLQRKRRGAIAVCRNRLLKAGLESGAEWFLFVDVDMAVVPPETLVEAMRWNAPILMANCLKHAGAGIFDLNAFRYTRPISDRHAARYVSDGIYQPPGGYFRHYPSPNSPHEIEPLHSVGGTFLLIRRDVVVAGADFPEEPYQMHIETEGFALSAAELGFGAFMPPHLIVRHGEH